MISKGKNTQKLNTIRLLKKYSYVIIILMDKTKTLRYFSNGINKLLNLLNIKLQFNKELNYRTYNRIFKKSFKSSYPNKNIVLFPLMIGIESAFNLRQMMLAKFLEDKGFSPLFLVCNRFFDICSRDRIGKTRENTVLFCYECVNNYKSLEEETNIPIRYFSDFNEKIDNKILVIESNRIEILNSIKDCQNYRMLDGTPIGNLTYVGVLRHFVKGILTDTPKEIGVFKKYLKASVKTNLLFNHIFKNFNVHTTILWNGALSFDSVISHQSRINNVPFVTQEAFVGVNSWIYKKNGIAIHLNYDIEWERYRDNTKLTENQREKVLDLFKGFRSGTAIGVKYNDSINKLNLSNDTRYVVLYTNLNFDTYVLGRNPVFDSMYDWIIKTIDFWKRNIEGIRLIIRAHPAEVKLLTPSTDFVSEIVIPRMNEKIIFYDSTDEVNSYEIFNHVDYVLTYSSTIGIEAMLAGIPNLVAGEAFYKQYAISPTTQNDYFAKIKELNIDFRNQMINKDELIQFLFYIYYIRTKEIEGFYFNRQKGNVVVKDSLTSNELINLNREILEEFYQEIFCHE